MNKILKNVILNNYCHISDTLLKYSLKPRSIVIEPIAGCNISCIACPATELKRKTGVMKLNDFKEILGKIPNINHIGLFFMGEPLINPNIFDMIRLAKERKITTVISTNSTTLKKDYKKIVDSGLNVLKVCLDGFSSESINEYRKGSNFDEIIEGIERICKYRSDANSPLKIIMRTLVFKQTEPELPEIKNFAEKVGVDNLMLVTPILDNLGGKKNEYADSIKPSEKWLRPSNYRNKPPKPCPWVSRFIVTWNGELLPCCNDVHGLYSYGNILKKNFKELYWSSEGRKLREKIVNCKLDICINCQRASPSEKKVKVF